jgi:hypothetical protein
VTDADWRALIREFVEGRLSADDFHDRFLASWHAVRDAVLPEPKPVSWRFFEVEACCGDPALRGKYEIDAEQLLVAARRALEQFSSDVPR